VTRLTDEQRDLAARHVEDARAVANAYARHHPRMAPDIESAAMLGLMDAASRFDAGRGLSFRTLMTARVRGSILDMMRTETGLRRKDEPDVWPASVLAGMRSGLWQSVYGQEAGEGRGGGIYAGFEPAAPDETAELVDAADAVEAVARTLPPPLAEAVRAKYLRAFPSDKAAAASLGIGDMGLYMRLRHARRILTGAGK